MSNSPLREEFPTLVGQYFEVWACAGWLTLVKETLEQLRLEQANAPALRVYNIKEKLGQLRISGAGFSDHACEIREGAAEKSSGICAICGVHSDEVRNNSRRLLNACCTAHLTAEANLIPDVSNEYAKCLRSRLRQLRHGHGGC